MRGELIKLRTTRTFVALVGTALVLSLLLTYLFGTAGDAANETDARHNLMLGDASGIVILLLGAIGMTGEWRHRTITGTVLAAPSRVRLLAAKALSHSLAGVALSLVVTTSVLALGTLVASGRGQETLEFASLADILWRSLIVASVMGALGVVVGALVRNQTVAVVGVIVMAFLVEGTLMTVAPEVGRFLPFNGLPIGILGGVGGVDNGDILPVGAAIALSLGWLTAGFAGAAVLLRRRDLV